MTSRWQAIWEERERQWLRLKELEQRMDESALRKRRRLANLLDETPTHRRSRLRLFCTHSVLPPQPASPGPTPGPSTGDPSKPEEKDPIVIPAAVPKSPSAETWKLLVEGKLLVGHLDHKSAAKVEEEAAEAAGIDPNHIAQTGISGTEGVGGAPNLNNPAGADAQQPLVRSTDRTQYRGISEKEGDEPVHPILFTHFFDKVSVVFQTIYHPPHPAIVPVEMKTPKKGRGKKRTKQVDPAVWGEERLKKLLTSSPPTEIIWKRHNQRDANAFVVTYKPPLPSSSSDDGLIQHSVIATISLYPRPSPEESQYEPSPALADALFSKNSSQDVDGDGRRRRKPVSAKKRKRAEAGAGEEENSGKADAPPELPKEIPTENDIVVPKTFPLQEIVSCIFMYAEHNKLLDPNDRSSIVNDKVLSALFECERMNFAELQQRLLDRKLITKANDSPVVLTYVMKKGNGSISPLDKADEKTSTVKDYTVSEAKQSEATSSKDQDDEEDVGPSCLSLDIDVNVPALFHYRVRELMRRIKRREFEYTSSRTKARNMLVTSRATEDVVKTRIEEAVCGRGYTPDHIPVWLALAKAAPTGSEARAAAQIDARTCALLGKLHEHCAAAKAAWSVVDACCQSSDGSTTDEE